MSVYYSVILLICSAAVFGAKDAKEKGKFYIISATLMVLILTVVAGLRYRVGTDYMGYYLNYDDFKVEKLSLFEEPVVRFVARVTSYIYDSPALYMFISSAIIIVPFAVTIIKNSQIYWFSILLYIFLGCWHGSFNGVRQFMAAAVLFAGHTFIKQKKFFKWCLIVFLACLCHISAAIAIFFYFFANMKISFKQIPVCAIIILLGLTVYDRIYSLIGFLKGTEFDFEGAGADYLLNSINPLRIAVAWIPVIFFIVFIKFYDKEDEKFNFYFNMSLLNAVLMTVAMNSTYLGRVGIFTGVYNTIIWPMYIKKFDKKNQVLIIAVLLVMYFIYWYAEAGSGSLSNFRWIFNR